MPLLRCLRVVSSGCGLVSCVLLAVGVAGVAQGQQAASPRVAGHALPLVFEQNVGQMAAETAFAGRAQGYALEVQQDGLRFDMQGSKDKAGQTISVTFEGSKGGQPVGLEEAAFRTNYYVGNDPKQWHAGVKNFDRVGLMGLYPGVDATFYVKDGGARGSEIEHDFLVAAGADASQLAMRVAGAKAQVDPAGDVELKAAGAEGYLRLMRPVAYQVMADGSRKTVDARFALSGEKLGFVLGAYDRGRELVIDPVITYATFVAGTAGSTASAVSTDSSGNVYLSGTTSSTTFGSESPVKDCPSGSCGAYIFVIKFASGSNGATAAWLTYIGGPSAGTNVVTSSVASAATVFVGGFTNKTSLATGTSASVSNSTAGYVGFFSGLATASGALSGTNFVYSDPNFPNNNSVEAMALDTSNDLYLTGALGAGQVATQAMTPTANAFAVSPILTAYTSQPTVNVGNAYVAEYPSAAVFTASPTFFTYIHTNALASGVAVDSANNVYVSGYTAGGFAYPAPASYTNNSGGYDSFEITFKVNAGTTAPTVGAFTWINGSHGTQATSLAIDGAGNSYLFGTTFADDMNLTASLCDLQCGIPDVSGSGFVIKVAANGSTPAYDYLGGSGTVDFVNGGKFGNNTIYAVGQTNAPSGSGTPFAATSTAQTAVSPFNTKALAYGEDNTAGGTSRGFLVSLTADLQTVNYVANLGGASGSDTAASVAVDAAGNAYVAANIGNGSTPYTTNGAFQKTSVATGGAAAGYLAEVSGASTAYGLTLTAAPGSPSTNPLSYNTQTSTGTSVNYLWTVKATANLAAANVTLSVAALTNLTYTSAQLTDVTSGGTAVGSCSIASPGLSCVIPGFPQTVAGVNDTLLLTLGAAVNSTAYTSGTTITITATGASPASEYVTSSQVSTLVSPSSLVISMGTPTAAGVYAASTNYATYAGTTVTYPIKVTNSGAGAGTAPAATLSFAGPFPAGFTVTAVAAAVSAGSTIASCDTTTAATGCSSVSLIANGVLTYSITGYYSDVTLFPAGTAAGSATSGTFNVAATGSGGNTASAAALATGTTITRAVDLSVGTGKSSLVVDDGLSTSTPKLTFNLSTAATPAPVNYVYTVNNAGPSIAYNVPLTAAFPVTPGTGSFAVSGVVGTDSAGNAVSCTYATSLSCTVGEINPGTSVVVTVTASYPDLAPLADAVSAPNKSASYGIAGTAVAPGATYVKYATGSLTAAYATATVLIERTAAVTVVVTKTTSVAPVCGTGGTANPCVYMYNAAAGLNANANQYDTAAYTITVTNAGPNAATGSTVTIPLPTAPATTGTTPTTHPLTVTSVTATPSSIPAGWAGDVIASCTSTATTATCGSLTTSGTIGIPVGVSVGISLNGTFDSATVPVTVESVNTLANPGTATVTAAVFAGLPSTATKLQTYSVVRSSHLIIRKSRNGTVDVAPGTYIYPNDPDLDEKTAGTTFGVDDEIEYEVAIGNGGANNAPGVTVSDTLQPYFTVDKTFLIASTSLTPDTTPNQTPVGASVGAVTCYAGATATGTALTLPYSTGASTQLITCTMPAGYQLAADQSVTAAPGASGIEFVYQGKFQNNFPAADDIPSPLLLYTVTSSAGDATDATSLSTDYQAGTDEMSAALPPYQVQRVPVVPVITIAPIAAQTFGNPPITVSATSTSPAPITFSIASGPATVAGSTVTLTGAATVCVAASQVASGSYGAGTAQLCFAVAQSAQTINVSTIATAVTFGNPPIALSAVASSGLAVTYALVSGPATLSNGTLTITGAGTVVITANQAGNGNYLPAPAVAVTITVLKASPVVTWPAPASIAYGTALSATQLDAVVTGVGGTALAGTPVYTPGPGTVLPVGAQQLTVAFTPSDAADYTVGTGATTLIVGRGTPTLTVVTSAATVFVTNAVTFTATMKSAGVAPTGTVNFEDGTAVIGTGTISNGVATFTTSALTGGSHPITGVYTGDGNYGSATSAVVTETVEDFTLAAGTSSQTVQLSASVGYPLTVTPVGGTTIASVVNFTVSGLPAGATVSFSPASVAAGAAATTVTMTIVAPATFAKLEHGPSPGREIGYASLALALLLLPFGGQLRRRAGRLSRIAWLGLMLLAGAATAMGISGCSGTTPTTPSETFVLTVNATSGSLIHATTVTLVVQ